MTIYLLSPCIVPIITQSISKHGTLFARATAATAATAAAAAVSACRPGCFVSKRSQADRICRALQKYDKETPPSV